ncbi:hypothetical protein SynA1560_01821 [Synechococcus sp. A15-60]|nr:hypothetical protein SynA1560_01821 [Synechococcus sp. A15-60]
MVSISLSLPESVLTGCHQGVAVPEDAKWNFTGKSSIWTVPLTGQPLGVDNRGITLLFGFRGCEWWLTLSGQRVFSAR